MASDEINKDDILGGLGIELLKLISVIQETKKANEEFIISQKNFIAAFKGGGSKDIKDLYKSLDLLNKAIIQHKKITNEEITAKKRLVTVQLQQAKIAKDAIDLQKKKNQADATAERLSQQKIQTSIKQSQAEKILNAQIKQEAKERENAAKQTAKEEAQLKKLSSAYLVASGKLNTIRAEYKDLAIRQKLTNDLTDDDVKRFDSLGKELTELDKTLKQVDASAGQFQREVGNYKGAIGDALKDTGFFNNGIGQLIQTFKDLKKQQAEATEGQKGFNKLIIAGGIAIAAVVVGALVKAAKAGSELNETLKETFAKLAIDLDFAARSAALFSARAQGLNVNLFLANKLEKELIETNREYQKSLRDLSLQLQQVALDEQDFIEISNDTTIGFKERNLALKEAESLAKQRAKFEIDIATKELERVNKEVIAREALVGLQNVSPELLEKQTQAQLKLNSALDIEADLTRQQAAVNRARNVAEATQSIELLRSKKLSADSQSAILEKQLQDDKIQLAERRKIAKQISLDNIATTKQEIKIFKEKLGVQFNEQSLLDEKNPIRLAEKLKELKQLDENNKLVGLGEEAITELAKVVKQYQENRLKGAENIAKLDDEELKRDIELGKINTQRFVNEQKFKADIAQENLNDVQDSNKKSFDNLLENENAFNRKKLKLRKLVIESEKESLEENKTAQINALESQAVLERQEIVNSENDELLRAEKIKDINLKLAEEKRKILKQNLADHIATNAEIESQEKELTKKRIQIIAGYTDKFLSAIDNQLQQSQSKHEADSDKQIDIRNKNIDRQRELSEKGLENQLAFEESKLAKEELIKAENLAKDKRNQQYLAFLKLLTGYAQENPDTALSRAFTDIAIAKGAEVLFAATGAENIDGKGTETSDSIPAMLSKGESVITAKATKEAAGLATAWNEGRLTDWIANEGLNKFVLENSVGQKSTSENISNSLQIQQLINVNKRLESLENTIANKRETNVNLNNLGEVILTQVENGVSVRTTFKNRKSRL